MIHSGAVQYHESLEPLMADIDSITQHERNYNGGDVEAITESIMVSGMYRPVFVQKSTRKIIAGNHTWEACKTLGATEIPVVELDVDDTTAIRLMVADNRIAAMAQPDHYQLIQLLSELDMNDSLIGTGYRQHDLEILMHLNDIPADTLDFAQWPTITVQVPPHVKRAYLAMTKAAGDDRERFELLLRLAGWNGKD
jgi:ParB-like chromosome segregation protein Spo0J